MTIEEKSIDTIRCLAMDAVQKADSGHPGTPMALAPAAYALWMKHLCFNPANPKWFNRTTALCFLVVMPLCCNMELICI